MVCRKRVSSGMWVVMNGSPVKVMMGDEGELRGWRLEVEG